MKILTKRALEKSIRHWERMRDGKRRVMEDECGDFELEEPTAEFCALCRRFGDYGPPCQKGKEMCPIFAKTGEYECEETPYDQAREAWITHGPDSEEFKKAAAKEVEFLKGLL